MAMVTDCGEEYMLLLRILDHLIPSLSSCSASSSFSSSLPFLASPLTSHSSPTSPSTALPSAFPSLPFTLGASPCRFDAEEPPPLHHELSSDFFFGFISDSIGVFFHRPASSSSSLEALVEAVKVGRAGNEAAVSSSKEGPDAPVGTARAFLGLSPLLQPGRAGAGAGAGASSGVALCPAPTTCSDAPAFRVSTLADRNLPISSAGMNPGFTLRSLRILNRGSHVSTCAHEGNFCERVRAGENETHEPSARRDSGMRRVDPSETIPEADVEGCVDMPVASVKQESGDKEQDGARDGACERAAEEVSRAEIRSSLPFFFLARSSPLYSPSSLCCADDDMTKVKGKMTEMKR